MLKWAAMLAVITLTAVPARGFDNNRKGFILGGGLGLAGTSFSQKVRSGGLSIDLDEETRGGLLTDFRIGFGPSDQLLLYYASHVTWFSIENVFDDDVAVANGVSGFGVSYYFTPQNPHGGQGHRESSGFAPSWFVSGGLGFSTWQTPFEDESDTWSGFGLWFGGGYEFSRHWQVELGLGFGNPSDSERGITAETDASTIGIGIDYLAY